MKMALWVPGRFRLTNGMLSDLRAAGYADGRARGFDVDEFAAETERIRREVASAALNASMRGGCVDGQWYVHVGVFGHSKFDPDSWLLLGKAAVDGLVQGRVFGSDRFNLWELSGRTYRDMREQAAAALDLYQGAHLNVPMRREGFALTISEHHEGVGNA